MQRSGVWVFVVLIQSAGIILIIASTVLLVILNPFSLRPNPDLVWQMQPSAYNALVSTANTTIFASLVGYLIVVVFGLMAIAAGQGLIVLMSIDKSLRVRRASAQRPLEHHGA